MTRSGHVRAVRPWGAVSIRRVVGIVLVGAVVLTGLVLATADPFTLVFYVAYVGVSVALLGRQAGNVIAWLLMGIGFAFLTTTTPGLDVQALKAGVAEDATWFRAWAASWGGTLSYVGFVALAVVFPSGRLPAGWRGRLAGVTLLACVAGVAVMAVAPTMVVNPDGVRDEILRNPFAIAPDWAGWDRLPPGSTSLTIIPVAAALAVAAVSMVIRYRRATGILRLQLRWLVAAMTALVMGVVFGLVVAVVIGQDAGVWGWIPVILAFPTIPIAIGIAVTRYRLFDIDRLISRTIGWAVVTGALVVVFGALVIGLQSVLSDVTQGETLAVAISTLAAFAVFQPVRRRVQTAVDRRFDRARYDRQRTVDAFAGRIRDEVDLSTLRRDLVATTDDAVRPVTAAVWLRGSGGASR